jgi:hypothetical protein
MKLATKTPAKAPYQKWRLQKKIGKMAACKMAFAVGRTAAITEALKKKICEDTGWLKGHLAQKAESQWSSS